MDDINEVIAVRDMLNDLTNYQTFLTGQDVVEYWQPRRADDWNPTMAPPNLGNQPEIPEVLDELSGELDEHVGHELDDEMVNEPPNEASRKGMVFRERRLFHHYYEESDRHFKHIFRMVPQTFDNLLDEIEPHLRSPGTNNLGLFGKLEKR